MKAVKKASFQTFMQANFIEWFSIVGPGKGVEHRGSITSERLKLLCLGTQLMANKLPRCKRAGY